MLPPAPTRLDMGRILLRRLIRDDAPALFDMFSHPEVTRYWSAAPFTEMAQAEKKIEDAIGHYANDTAYPLAVVRVDDDCLIGYCTLWTFHRQNRRAEVGYVLARPYWGHGYMHEAIAGSNNHGSG